MPETRLEVITMNAVIIGLALSLSVCSVMYLCLLYKFPKWAADARGSHKMRWVWASSKIVNALYGIYIISYTLSLEHSASHSLERVIGTLSLRATALLVMNYGIVVSLIREISELWYVRLSDELFKKQIVELDKEGARSPDGRK